MKLEEIMVTGDPKLVVAKFRGDSMFEDCDTCLELDSTMTYYWNELERRIKHKLAEKLGLEEPLHKNVNVHDVEEFYPPDTTNEYVDRDLGLKERDCDH